MAVDLVRLFQRIVHPCELFDPRRWPERVAGAFASLELAALEERERWPLWLPVALGAGIAFYFALPTEPELAWAVLAIIGVLACVFGFQACENGALRVLLSLAAAMSLGFAVAKVRTETVAAPILSKRVGPIGLEGRVEQAELRGKGMRLILGELRSRRFSVDDRPQRVRISVRATAPLPVPGSWLHVTAVLSPPPSPAAPGAFDFGRAAYFQRLGGVGFGYGRPRPIGPSSQPVFLNRAALLVEELRSRIAARIHSVLPGSTGGIGSALITGNRGAISDDDEKALRDAGLAHVLAIAGLHMALVGLGLFWIVRAVLATIPRLALSYPIKKWAAAAAICSSSFYLLISGASSASTRAFLMLATMLVAILFDRPALSMRSLAFAATIILLLGPESLLEPGFQMSFAAVTSLVAVAEWEAAHRVQWFSTGPSAFAGIWRYLRGVATTSLVGSIATIPYSIYHFDRTNYFSVLGNLLAMPVMGFVVMPAAALSVLLMPFGLDTGPLRVLGWGIQIMLMVGRWVSGLPGASSVVSAWPISSLSLVSLGGLWVGLWHRNWRWLGVGPILLGVWLAHATPPPDLLIGRDGSTVAVRTSDGSLKLFRPPKDKYSASEWLKRDGDDRSAEVSVAIKKDGVSCDALGCIAKVGNGTQIALALKPDALPEDCAVATVVVSTIPTRRACRGPKLVVDALDAARANGYAVWLSTPFRVESVQAVRGRRPWSTSLNPSRAQYRRMRPTNLP